MQKSVRLYAAVAALALAASAGIAGPFTAGNLVVAQIGDGTAPLAAGGTPVFLVEIDRTSGAIVQTIAMPTATSGASHALLVRGTSTSIGHLSRSVDGRYLTLAGIDGPLGGTSISATQAATNPRVIGRVDAAGNVDTTTALTDSYNADDIRAVVSTDGNDFWTVGTSGTASTAGVRYTTFGASSAVQLGAPPTNTRLVGIFSNQLYISSASGAFQGVSTVGAGLPTTGEQAITLLPGMPTAAGPSAYDFYFADANTLYVADDRGVVQGGGIQKWTFDGATWTLQYTLSSGLTNGCRGLTATTTGGVTTLWATSADSASASAGNKLVTVVDSGSASEFSVLATAPANALYRGIDFSPENGGPAPCYANCDGSTTAPILNVNDFICFQSKYAAQDPSANCDGSTTEPVLNVNDFICFQSQYAAGCP